jgi:hypothetical protein
MLGLQQCYFALIEFGAYPPRKSISEMVYTTSIEAADRSGNGFYIRSVRAFWRSF